MTERCFALVAALLVLCGWPAILAGQSDKAQSQPVNVSLSTTDADANTRAIQAVVGHSGHAIISPGSWPVRPISMTDGSKLTGSTKGVSELRLEIAPPQRYDSQFVVGNAIPNPKDDFVMNVEIRDLKINGNYRNINWKGVYGDGNAFGIYLRGAANCIVSNVEIENCWTDGIYISTVLGHANNTRDSKFENVVIHHCGRQGVSIVGGENLEFRKFKVHSIGRDAPLATSPRAAIDLEPEANVQRLVRNIKIIDWTIDRCGQGILVSGGHSAEPAENIEIRNIKARDLDGPQILAVRDVNRLTVENASGTNHHPPKGGLGVLLRNTTGQITKLEVQDCRGTNFPIRIDGKSDVRLNQLTLEGCERGALQIGNEPNQPPERTRVHIDDFVFQSTAQTKSGLPLIRVHSAEAVLLNNGVVRDTGLANYVGHLFTNAEFNGCRFDPAKFGIFDQSKQGTATGRGNNW